MDTFVQFDPLRRCPSCGGVHQANLTPAVIECQPALHNAAGVCHRTGKAFSLAITLTGKTADLGERLMLMYEMEIWEQILA